jgi:hypothetical protein
MSAILVCEQETPLRSRVICIVTSPLEPIDGIEVDTIPEPKLLFGKDFIHYVNPETKEQWYEYIDRPLTLNEEREKRLSDLETIILQMKGVI